MSDEVVVGGIYRHYRDKLYRVQALARHSETLEEMVVYEALYENPVSLWWVRPKRMFLENVETPAGNVPRFALELPAQS